MTRIRYCHAFSIGIILFPILSQYSIGIRGITLGELIILLISLILFYGKQYVLISRSDKCFFVFISWCYLITIVSFIYQQSVTIEVLTRMVRYLFYFLLILFCSSDFDWEYIRKPYEYICLAIACYVILQKIAFETAQIVLTNKILPMPWYAAAPGIAQMKEAYIKYFFQARGIFTEQGYVAHYLLPCMIFMLYAKDKSPVIKILKIFIVFLALWFTKSMQAVAIAVGIFGLYVLKNLFSKKFIEKKRGILFILPMAVFCIGVLRSSTGQLFVYRLSKHLFSGGSTSVRLLRGYAVFWELPFIYKILGVGIGNLDYFVLKNSIYTIFDSGELTEAVAGYVNGISQVLLYGGIIGVILFLILMINLVSESRSEMCMLVIIYLVLTLVEGTVFNGISVFYLMLIFSEIKKERLLKNGI